MTRMKIKKTLTRLRKKFLILLVKRKGKKKRLRKSFWLPTTSKMEHPFGTLCVTGLLIAGKSINPTSRNVRLKVAFVR